MITTYKKFWPTKTEKKADVLLVHGLGEHCNRYQAFAEHLNINGYSLSSIDLPGHGQSAGQRGHIDAFADYQKAIMQLYNEVNADDESSPKFLFGHSMGGLIATYILLHHATKFAGAILSGAAIKSPQEPPAWQIGVVRMLAKLTPTLGVLPLDASAICRDPDVVENYFADPLVNTGKLSARFLVEISDAMDYCRQQAASISLPILILHGDADVVTSPQGSKMLYETVSSTDKELQMYSGLYHEILNEPEAPQVRADISNWLDAHLPKEPN